MRKKILVILLSIISVICVAFGAVACDSSESGSSAGSGQGTESTESGSNDGTATTKQVPVYQGMVISSAESSASAASAKVASATLADQHLTGGDQNGYYDDYGNYYDGNGGYYDVNGSYHDGYYDYYYDHYHYRGDYEGKDEDIDYDQPYDEETPTIEQEIETTLKVTGTGQDIYYADKGEDIYITVVFSNPDSYEILSFVINGTKYTSYMFQNGSDLENIIVKLNVGTVGGINEYTIDEIKYVDGTEIKDVLLNGDTVVKCGVRADDQTYATVSNEIHDLNSISFTAKIVDLYSLIEYSDGYVMAVLYDGESLVQTVDLTVGTNTVQFTNLTPNTLYQYAIVALYDDLSGTGTALNYLYKNAVYTDTIVLFDNITVGQESITFGYSWYDGYSAATITQLTLTSGGKTQTLENSSATSVTGLLTNTEYVLTAYYVNLDGATESISLTFTTLEKATPVVVIETLTSEQESVNYGLAITDTDSVGSITSVTLSLNGKTVETLTSATGNFSGLLSNNEYTVTVVYTYNLNDGTGSHELEVTDTITTQAKATPVVVIDTLTSTQTAVDYALDITDTDSVGSITSVTLTLGKNEIGSFDTATGTFSGLLSNNTYTLTVVYTYDLNDGKGEQKTTVTKDIATEAKATPVVVISGLTSTQTTVDYALDITDTDSVGSITSVTLSLNGKTVETLTSATGNFSGLLSNNTYTVTVVYTYDLNDGTGSHELKVTDTITTQAKATPVVVIETLTSTQTTVDYTLDITDIDTVGAITSVTLTLGETVIKTVTTENGTFDGLLSNNTYTLTVVYTYDLNDGKGEQKVTVTKDITTVAKTAPTVDIGHNDSDTTSLAFTITFTDDDNTGAITSIGLYNDSTLVEEITDLTKTELEFTGLDSEIQYTLKVNYKYDLNDGNDETEATKTVSAYTSFVVGFETFSVLNTSAVSEGETIVVQAEMYNPDNVTFTAIVVNGETYSVSSVSTYKKIRAEIVYNGQFEGGNTAITVSQLICTLNGKTYTVDISQGNTAYVFINGELTVNDISVVHLVDGQYEETYYGFYTEQLYYQITLNNATCYDVYSVTIGGTTYDSEDITMSDDYQVAYVAINTQWEGYCEHSVSFSSISYSNSNIDKTKTVDFAVYYIRLTSDEIIEITTAEQLLDVDDYKYYKLMNDIDLSGYEWVNMYNSMYGVFDGNGYSIKNMSAVTTYYDTELYIGLFTGASGAIKNLNVTDALYMITVNNTTGNTYHLYAGGIVANTRSNTLIENSNVEISIQVTNNNEDGETFVGGVVGTMLASCITIKDVVVSANISITSLTDYNIGVGGIAGWFGCYDKFNLTDLTVDLTAVISADSGYSAGAYFGYSEFGTYVVENSTADYAITYKDNDIVYNGIDGFEFKYSNGAYTLTGYYGSDTDIVLPDSIDGNTYTIGSYAFANNTSITSIIIPASVTVIGYGAFENCTSLVSVIINSTSTSAKSLRIVGGETCEPESSTVDYSIGSYAFSNCTALKYVIIGNNISTIGSYAFNNCSAEITWADDIAITEIGSYVFANYAGTSITISASVTTIGSNAFNNCTAEIIWADNIAITEIGNGAFAGYKGTSITIPNSVTTIGEYAFQNCTAEIIWGENTTIKSFGTWSFAGYKGESITIPASVIYIGEGAFSACTAEIIWSENSSLTEITTRAFAWYAGTNLVIPDYITKIGDYAFYYCTADSITIGSGITYMDAWVFYGCTSEIIWGENISIKQLTSYYFAYYAGTSIIVPESVTVIDTYAFSECTALTSVVIGKNVTSISNYAFYNCISLTTVYYGGTESEWSSVTIGDDNNDCLTSATIYYYSETEPTESGNYWHYNANNEIEIWS